MSIVIIGGHDRMVCQYKSICRRYGCKAKIYTQANGNLEGLIGKPDLIVLFTNPVSHEMARTARTADARTDVVLDQSHCASGCALRKIMERRVAG
jgi:hypothetical protein